MINDILDIEEAFKYLKNKFISYKEVEAIYLIDASTSKQIHNTIMEEFNNRVFKPSIDGEEHFLKEYYYITLESKRGIYLSPKYISYATGNICKTFAKKFKIKENTYILCLDIVIREL